MLGYQQMLQTNPERSSVPTLSKVIHIALGGMLLASLMYFLWNICTRESQNCRTIDVLSLKGPIKIESDSWLHTAPSKIQSVRALSNAPWTPRAWGYDQYPGDQFHAHLTLVKNLFPSPTWPSPDAAPCSPLRSCLCHQRSVPASPNGFLPPTSLPLTLAQRSPGCLCPCGQWFYSDPGVLPVPSGALPPLGCPWLRSPLDPTIPTQRICAGAMASVSEVHPKPIWSSGSPCISVAFLPGTNRQKTGQGFTQRAWVNA